MNVAYLGNLACGSLSSGISAAAEYALGKKTVGRVRLVSKALKILLLQKVGYYNRITSVYLHSGRSTTDVTRAVKRIDPVVAKSSFITSSAFFFHEMGLDLADVLEIRGLDSMGEEFRFVIDWDSEIALPLMNNLDNDKILDKSICNATAVYGEVKDDITTLVRKWTRCSPIERSLPYIGRDYFNQSDELLDAVLEASPDDRFEIHVLYSDMTSRKMVYEKSARFLINL